MDQQFCTQCGARLPETGAFCPSCGARTQRQPPPPPAVPIRAAAPSRQAAPVGRKPWLITLSVFGVAALLGGVVYFTAIRPRQSPAVVEPCVAGEECAGTAVADVHNEEGIPYPDIPRISVDKARTLYDAGSALFVDVRDPEAFAEAHVTDSLSIPLAEMESNLQSVIASLPRDAEIITYCT